MTFPVLSANGPSGYNLTNSLRFCASASGHLTRTPSSTGNRQIFTWSGWVKRGVIGNQYQNIFGAGGVGSGGGDPIYFQNDVIAFYANGGGGASLITTQVFRDPSAWYHFVFSVDTTQATAANRIRMYVNGVQITAFSTASYPAQNYNFVHINNSGVVQYIGTGYLNNFDGYLTEVNFIDGQALTPSSFGSTNATTGVWQPAKYTGTYGTNGFYLPFTNTTSTTTLGNDFSGNGNNWTTNNISLTPGVTYDSMTDVPTLTSATAANFATLNPLVPPELSTTFNDGNLRFVGAGAVVGSMGMGAKTYVEMIPASVISVSIGVGPMVSGARGGVGTGIQDSVVWFPSGSVFKDGSGVPVATYATFTSGDVCAFTFDPSNRQVTFYKNNTLQGSQTVSGTQAISFYGLGNTSASADVNFGQRPFAYTPPSGFLPLNTFNLPSSTIPAGNKFMDADVYTGNGSSQTRTLNFQPDFIWNKIRSQAYDHNLFDVIRGVDKRLISNLTLQELTITNALTAFNSNGYSVGNYVSINGSGESIVNWAWKANGAGVTNTAGTITSTVSANTTSGFSVVTYTGTGTTGTIGHGLGVAPSFIILKSRSNVDEWYCYHASLGATQRIQLSQTSGSVTTSLWNSTAPTSSVYSAAGGFSGNVSGWTIVAYCFAPIAGFSAFGSYTGNGSTDGPFIYTGFRPRWTLIKRTDSTASWYIHDSARDTYNAERLELYANFSFGEGTFVALDTLSNGFKMRNSDAAYNASGGTFVYACFAENPFRNALAR